MKNIVGISLIVSLMLLTASSIAQNPQSHWNFEKFGSRTSIELISGIADTLEGNFHSAEPGFRWVIIHGIGVRFYPQYQMRIKAIDCKLVRSDKHHWK